MAGADPCPDDLVRFAESLADASRPIVRRYFRSGLAVETKADATPVTAADREVEAVLRRMIEGAFPDHGVIGEELGSVRAAADQVWVLDPIDGTKAFITGKPMFGTLIALLDRGRPVLGIIDAPATGERWVGAAGRPTTLNGAPVHVRPSRSLDAAIVNSTTPEMFVGDDAAACARLRAAVGGWHYGGDCYAYALLASGFLDVVVEAKLKVFDNMALVPVIEGAGGVITDWDGRPLGRDGDGRALAAASRDLHEAARRLLRP